MARAGAEKWSVAVAGYGLRPLPGAPPGDRYIVPRRSPGRGFRRYVVDSEPALFLRFGELDGYDRTKQEQQARGDQAVVAFANAYGLLEIGPDRSDAADLAIGERLNSWLVAAGGLQRAIELWLAIADGGLSRLDPRDGGRWNRRTAAEALVERVEVELPSRSDERLVVTGDGRIERIAQRAPSLLEMIWRQLANAMVAEPRPEFVRCPVCSEWMGRPTRRRRYCGPACRNTAFRRRERLAAQRS